MWGETFKIRVRNSELVISIHSPRVGRDEYSYTPKAQSSYFNPLSPCGERREEVIAEMHELKFQSTLPVWGETTSSPTNTLNCVFQSTLPVWGETFLRVCSFYLYFNFNPLSPCGERPADVDNIKRRQTFQSTLPVWGETEYSQGMDGI